MNFDVLLNEPLFILNIAACFVDVAVNVLTTFSVVSFLIIIWIVPVPV